jgi:GTP cyclohydrolase I
VDEWVEFPWEHAIESDNESLVTRLIEIVGDDPTREDLLETPRRYLSALRELTSGYRTDPAPILARTFASSIDELLVVPNIEFYSLCEHHLLPFYGVVHVGYIPAGRILGLSKFARVVDVFARRLQTQERMTEQIADAINESVQPLGVGVIVRARHLCMAARGAAKQRASFTTSRVLGALRTSGPARDEFLRFLKGS